jgi:hypothetical protein
MVVRNASHRLEIRAVRAAGGLLHAPTKLEMGRRIMETLNAKIFLRLANLAGDILYEGIGENSGLEIVGKLDTLLKLVL